MILERSGRLWKKEDVSASLKGKSNISRYIREILQNAEKEVIICTNAKEMNSKLTLFVQTFKILKKSDIKIKIALSGDKDLIKQIEEKIGIKIKTINLDSKFFIIDRKEILFYLTKDPTKEDVAIWLNSEFFTQSFSALFDKAMGAKK